MGAAVRTVWPTFVGDSGKPPLFVVVWPGDHVYDYAQTKRSPHFTDRAKAKAHADRLNGVAALEAAERRP